MRHLSVKIPDDLYEQLEQKAKAMGQVKISDALRLLLQDILQSSTAKTEQKRYQQLLHYQLATYYMVQSHLVQSFEKGLELNDTAHAKAHELLQEILKKS
jgi:metal-responsive CopG/Arc/MetJ family transcriptional regulator